MGADLSSNEVEEIKRIIKEVLILVEEVPEPYKQESFGVLLSSFLQERKSAKVSEVKAEVEVHPSATPHKFVQPTSVKAFLHKYCIPEDRLQKLFYMEGNQAQPTYTITEKKPATAQIQLALLTALENALKGGRFEFLTESVKDKCIKWKCYDSSNFKNGFNYNPKLFVKVSYDEPIELSQAGLDRLANIILEIAK